MEANKVNVDLLKVYGNETFFLSFVICSLQYITLSQYINSF